MAEMHDPYEDQLSAARYRAERDAARQELDRLREKADKAVRENANALRLLAEDGEAARWVREHGGLDSVKKLLDWVVGHCSTKQQLDFDFWLSGRVMHELGFDEDTADRDEVERRLLDRLMPDGMELLRYDTGEPVPLGGEVTVTVHDEDGDFDRTLAIRSIKYKENGVLLEGTKNEMVVLSHGERVNRPAPKVLDADGVEIRVGDVLYRKSDGRMSKVVKVYEKTFTDADDYVRPGEGYTHRAPVLAADGEPLREGEHVYHVETGAELVVKELPKPREYQAVVVFAPPASHLTSFDPDQLTHERPVLDADGVPIHEGDTVYANGNARGDGTAWRVLRIDPGISHPLCCEREDGKPGGARDLKPEWVTHQRPDSWERIEEDAGRSSRPSSRWHVTSCDVQGSGGGERVMCAISKSSAMVEVTCKLSVEDGRASVRYSASSEYSNPRFTVDVPAIFEAMSKALAERGK